MTLRVPRLSCFAILISFMVATAFSQNNPIPLLELPLSPMSAAPGSLDLTLTVNGVGFQPGSVVDWNGKALTTTFVSGSKLQATVPSADLASSGTASVTVVNSAPAGTSNLAFFSVHAPISTLTFTNFPQNYGLPLTVAAVGDFNGDGKLDMAGLAGTNTVFLSIGNGDGSFAVPQILTLGSNARTLVAGDFNSDGKLDLAVRTSNDISVLLGNGDGTFRAPKTTAFTGGTILVPADFNRDGKLDLAISGSGLVSIMLGNGDGTFQSAVNYPTGGQAVTALGIGDFNRDGVIDLIAGDDGGRTHDLAVLLGNVDGTFQTALQSVFTLPETAGLNNIIVADLNGDNLLDLVIGADGGGGSGSFFFQGNGDGTFATPAQLIGIPSFGLTAGDFNSDGILDLAGSTNFGSTSIGLGNGNGTFQVVTLTGNISGLAGDFNGDGALDLMNGLPSSQNPFQSTQVQLQGAFQDFTLGPSIASLPVSSGQSNSLTLYISPVGGYSQSVSFTCAGAPSGVSCSLSPSSVTLDGSTTQQVKVTLSDGAARGMLRSPSTSGGRQVNFAFAMLMMGAALTTAARSAGNSKHRLPVMRILAFSCLAFLAAGMLACGGGNNGGGGGLPASGSHGVTITGTSSGGSKTITHSASFTLAVK